MNYSELHEKGRRILSDAGISEAALDARLLLEYITGKNRSALMLLFDRSVDEETMLRYLEIIKKRAEHVPLQHITGTCSFMGIDLFVNDKVLIPRQDSEILVEEAMRFTNDGADILDLCTGSGCLLLSLMHYKNGCRGIGCDIDEEALSVAKKNLAMLEESGGLNGGSVKFYKGDLFEALPPDVKKFDIIISNPPYIKSKDIPHLMPEVREHDPLIALDGGSDGLDFYRRIAKEAASYLAKDGMIFCEIGYDQSKDVESIFSSAGLSDIKTVKDYGGNDRVIYAAYR